MDFLIVSSVSADQVSIAMLVIGFLSMAGGFFALLRRLAPKGGEEGGNPNLQTLQEQLSGVRQELGGKLDTITEGITAIKTILEERRPD